ncbi:ATP/GTP-binding protein [Microbacterium sp. KUDC0406]|uniref:GTP-binding protein n=1 Tax=Microbacterium sp. KUDC0406 TaxID=2909588 RepID=UPI001F3DB3B0|nr:ATP/GTP-binding protein [Microbacterium sp. KUDC0406]UJP10271.1 ATP/GTP-binding protein [Microbacterium sp. KUDC0406]
MSEHVILFAGPMGAGKTTAIRSLSEIDVVSTEAANTERHLVDKPTTTVALDYGELTVGPHDKVRLYGAPGQRRFDFMWDVLSQRARGLMLLIGNDGPDPLGATREFLAEFRPLAETGRVVVVVTRSDVARTPQIDDYADALAAWYPDRTIPVFTADPRSTDHMRTLLMALVANVEAAELIAHPATEVA